MLILWARFTNIYLAHWIKKTEELEQKINNISENSIQISELNHVIDAIIEGIGFTNHLSVINDGQEMLSLLIFSPQQFAEYIEGIELGMQLTRKGIFNPKLLKHDFLTYVYSEKLLKI